MQSGQLEKCAPSIATPLINWYLLSMFTLPSTAPTGLEMQALKQAHDLMQEMRLTSGLPEDIRNELTFCLRHFPISYMFQSDHWNQMNGGGL